jgi:hypothetical protein
MRFWVFTIVLWLDDAFYKDVKSQSIFCTLEDYKPPKAVQSSRATLPINELKRTLWVRFNSFIGVHLFRLHWSFVHNIYL